MWALVRFSNWHSVGWELVGFPNCIVYYQSRGWGPWLVGNLTRCELVIGKCSPIKLCEGNWGQWWATEGAKFADELPERTVICHFWFVFFCTINKCKSSTLIYRCIVDRAGTFHLHLCFAEDLRYFRKLDLNFYISCFRFKSLQFMQPRKKNTNLVPAGISWSKF